jgi:HAE1 family hydrophobic/amphiphilic exporter-1
LTLPELAIRRPVTTLMIIISLVVLGGVALVRLPLAFLPEMDAPMLSVRVPYPNAPPDQVERLIVRPIEDVLGSVNGLKRLSSHSTTSGGTVELHFDWSADLHLARAEVWEKLNRIRRELPEDIEDIVVGTGWHWGGMDDPILKSRLSSKLDLSESYTVLERRVIKPLERVPGVAQVRLDGVNPREVRINLRLADLELHSIDVREVSRILRSSNFDQSLGVITDGDSRFTVRTLATFRTVEEIRELVLRPDGLRLRDVADVIYEEPPLQYGRHLDGNFAVGITVGAEAQANSVEVCDAVEERIARMDDDPALAGVKLLVRFSEGREIKKTLKELLFAGIFGALLASMVLYVFLRRWSTTLISVLCVPFSLIVTCGFIWAQGSTLNTLTLLGLIVGIGMLVDNAVVVIESIFRHQEKGRDHKTAARLGAREVSTAIVAATLTSVIVFLPIVFNKPSRMNIQFKEIGVTVCLTLVASLFISQTLIPLATSWFIKAKPRPKEQWMVWLENRYVRLLELNLRRRWLAPAIGIAVTVSAIYPFRKVDMNFSSGRTPLHVTARYEFSEPRSLEAVEALVTQAEKCLEPHREELLVGSIYSFWREGHAEVRIYLKEGQATEENLARVRTRMRELVPDFPGAKAVIQPSRETWRNAHGKRIGFQIVGDDYDVLAKLADEARQRVEGIEGLSTAYSSGRQGRQELHVVMDRDLVARYGVSSEQLAETVGLTFRGRRLQRFRTPDGETEMRLTLEEQEVESLSQLHNLPMWTDAGEKVPLAAVATFAEHRRPHGIRRDGRRTSVWVGAEYEQGTREQYLPKVTAALDAMSLPYGYSWTFGAWRQQEQARSQEFLINLLLALLLVFAVMSGLFESVQRALALMIALPFALSGAMWTLYLTETDFNQAAAVGTLLLIGIVVNNGIVMLEHINAYQRGGLSRYDSMLKGGRERLRPILMTALTTLLGLAPIIVQKPSLGGMSYVSMALVVAGGISVSTFLTTLLLPTTVTLVEDFTGFVGRRLRWGRVG